MEALRIALVCVAGALLCAVLRAQRPELAVGVAIATGLVAMYMMLSGLGEGVRLIGQLADDANLGSETTGVLIRATGIALVVEFAAQLCKDAGEGALAGRIELGGRVALMVLAIPMISDLIGQLAAFLP